jgi:pilus assembly protein Flp/PilA
MRAFFTKLIDDETGVTAVEYGLIAALIAVAAVTIMTTVGTNLSSTFSKVAQGGCQAVGQHLLFTLTVRCSDGRLRIYYLRFPHNAA